MIKLEINNFIRSSLSLDFLKKIVKKVSAKEKKRSGKVSLALVDEKTIKKLNAWYRGENKITDVLSFALDKPKNFILPTNKENYLGEIIICYPQAKKQAKKLGHSLQKEIEILFLHGLLHLLGYSHKKMRKDYSEYFH